MGITEVSYLLGSRQADSKWWQGQHGDVQGQPKGAHPMQGAWGWQTIEQDKRLTSGPQIFCCTSTCVFSAGLCTSFVTNHRILLYHPLLDNMNATRSKPWVLRTRKQPITVVHLFSETINTPVFQTKQNKKKAPSESAGRVILRIFSLGFLPFFGTTCKSSVYLK